MPAPLDLDALCARGEAADLLYNLGQYDEAERAYLALYEQMHATKVIDLFIASKIALGLLLTRIENQQVERAFQLFTSRPSDDVGEGIYGIEHGHTTRHDMVVYRFVSSFFHSISTGDRTAASEAINTLMEQACDYARANDPPLLPLAIKDWKLFLMQLHGPAVPPEVAVAVMGEQERYGRDIPLDGIDFPPPSVWRKDDA